MVTQTSDTRPLVLAIDDDTLILRYLRVALERAGYRSATLDDPRDVLAQIRDDEPDLILLDVRLPGTDGFELYGEIRQISSSPVIFLTASSSPQVKQQALSIGASGFVVKPFSPPELLAAIHEVLPPAG